MNGGSGYRGRECLPTLSVPGDLLSLLYQTYLIVLELRS